ncbi:DICT sensory domain-containing protein [Nocardioides sp. GCM10030258]|uniref:DICT sensory domain-containing protein n=1 Tax=unclassified Nocardioides TaxID=2615069 RepID=UPI00360AB94A
MDQSDAIAPVAAGAATDLTIGDLAQRTGLTPAVIRTWELRHGFPAPRRLDSGHRRYSADDVAVIQQILRRRDAGVRLDAAINEAVSHRAPTSPSIFAELRRRHPALVTHRLRKTTLLGLSHAIEDECCATADRPILFGAFQRADLYGPSAARWTELARVARSAMVFADLDAARPTSTTSPVQIHLADDAPLRREWAVVCDAQDTTACLSAWELPGQTGVADRDRVFEAVWTVDPHAVRDAARVAAQVAADAGNAVAQLLTRELADPPVTRSSGAQAATALFNRAIAYVDRLR